MNKKLLLIGLIIILSAGIATLWILRNIKNFQKEQRITRT